MGGSAFFGLGINKQTVKSPSCSCMPPQNSAVAALIHVYPHSKYMQWTKRERLHTCCNNDEIKLRVMVSVCHGGVVVAFLHCTGLCTPAYTEQNILHISSLL